ncbi:hypothetical protein C8F04DRAFT_1132061 [Mycena alexandri]|uniref:F-box domain-containing protein n=1 Tax=Mycena alexandri TaxID=1745969 RepID=A0AAD6SAJ7_9AGAR|nr:hypothetical protein C8F04DRAFT_1132061 [Mycena alexandri]
MSLPLTVGWSPGLTNVEIQVKCLIEAAEANIARLTAQIRELDCLRAKERNVLATLRLMIVPIGKLPTEILIEIFKHAVQTPILADEDPWGDSILLWSRSLFQGNPRAAIDKVLRLSRVCSYWRKVVDTTPALWAEGVVSVTAETVLAPSYLDGLKCLLARSTPYPISVAFASNTKTIHFNSWARHILPVMLPTAQRWRNLNIDLPSVLHFNELPPGTFDSLECLLIHNLSGQTGTMTVFQSSPRLWSFALKTGASKIHLILGHLPWRQLTHIDIDDDSLGGCRAALLQCSNIVSARITTSYEWNFGHEATQSPIVVLPFLKTLIMSFRGLDNNDIGFEAFFIPFSLPSLTKLGLQFDSDNDEFWPMEEFSVFQDRSPNVQEIKILLSAIDSEGLIALLRHGPSIQILDIQNSWSCVDDAFFEALYYDEADSAPLAPKLENIHLEYVGDDFDESHLERAIRSRWWKDEELLLPDGSRPRVSRLTRACLMFTDEEMSDGLKARMKELATQGLDISL